MVFKSEQSIFSYFIFVVLLGVFGFIAVFAPNEENKGENLWIPLTIIGLIFAFLVYSILNTLYIISGTTFSYQYGFFKKKIDIQIIRKIEYNNSIFVPVSLKLGWSHKGLIINYNQYNDVYISPKNRDQFVAELLKNNPNIIIKE
ncbi:PH domain-containing protein [Flavobacterium ardleyense]|uniref:PH domain-containing protein n=1 Tax=Flavobacterium ardleyense TaxID=2038737 RepID=A0ABW5ZAF5_9FLAO